MTTPKTFRFSPEMQQMLEQCMQGMQKEMDSLGLKNVIDVNQTNAIFFALQTTRDYYIENGYIEKQNTSTLQ